MSNTGDGVWTWRAEGKDAWLLEASSLPNVVFSVVGGVVEGGGFCFVFC